MPAAFLCLHYISLEVLSIPILCSTRRSEESVSYQSKKFQRHVNMVSVALPHWIKRTAHANSVATVFHTVSERCSLHFYTMAPTAYRFFARFSHCIHGVRVTRRVTILSLYCYKLHGRSETTDEVKWNHILCYFVKTLVSKFKAIYLDQRSGRRRNNLDPYVCNIASKYSFIYYCYYNKDRSEYRCGNETSLLNSELDKERNSQLGLLIKSWQRSCCLRYFNNAHTPSICGTAVTSHRDMYATICHNNTRNLQCENNRKRKESWQGQWRNANIPSRSF